MAQMSQMIHLGFSVAWLRRVRLTSFLETEQNRMVQTTRHFELFDKKPGFS